MLACFCVFRDPVPTGPYEEKGLPFQGFVLRIAESIVLTISAVDAHHFGDGLRMTFATLHYSTEVSRVLYPILEDYPVFEPLSRFFVGCTLCWIRNSSP